MSRSMNVILFAACFWSPHDITCFECRTSNIEDPFSKFLTLDVLLLCRCALVPNKTSTSSKRFKMGNTWTTDENWPCIYFLYKATESSAWGSFPRLFLCTCEFLLLDAKLMKTFASVIASSVSVRAGRSAANQRRLTWFRISSLLPCSSLLVLSRGKCG